MKTHDLFFIPSAEGRDFSSVLREVQEFVAEKHSVLIAESGDESKAQIRRYVLKYLQDKRIAVSGMTSDELADALYTEMAEFGFLTKYIFGSGVEEIDSATRS